MKKKLNPFDMKDKKVCIHCPEHWMFVIARRTFNLSEWLKEDKGVIEKIEKEFSFCEDAAICPGPYSCGDLETYKSEHYEVKEFEDFEWPEGPEDCLGKTEDEERLIEIKNLKEELRKVKAQLEAKEREIEPLKKALSKKEKAFNLVTEFLEKTFSELTD